MSKEQEYKEIFLAEAQEGCEELNKLLTLLEKNTDDKSTVNSIFRITHTLKGNAAGMGFQKVAEFAHVMEDIFGEIRADKLALDNELFASLFKGVDVLDALVQSVKDGKTVKYRGIKTKLEVILKGVQDQSQEKVAEQPASTKPKSKKSKGNAEEKKASVNKKPTNTEVQNVAEQAGESADTGSDQATPAVAFSDLVQVPVRKLDNLLNLVGELIIERDRMIATHTGQVNTNEYARLNRISSDLQYSVMDVRLVQVGFLFNKFHRVVRDTAALENKKVALHLQGTETEIDRNILQIISDSLIHLIRNAVGHGMESPEQRKKAGKPDEGTITLKAFSESDAVVIQIQDDGQGINTAKVREKALANGLITNEDAQKMTDNDMALMIFEPGFSTMDQVTSIAGRGVGMDVVKKALDAIGGNITVDTEQGVGTTFSLRLPASMAVKGTLLFELSKETYAIPLSYTEAVVSLYKPDIHKVAKGLVTNYLDKTIAVVFLRDLFELGINRELAGGKILQQAYDSLHAEEKLDMVVVNYNGRMVGFVVDKLLQQKEIVEKSLTSPFDKVKIISGVTIMGNGHVCLVINVPAICNMIFSKSYANTNSISY